MPYHHILACLICLLSIASCSEHHRPYFSPDAFENIRDENLASKILTYRLSDILELQNEFTLDHQLDQSLAMEDYTQRAIANKQEHMQAQGETENLVPDYKALGKLYQDTLFSKRKTLSTTQKFMLKVMITASMELTWQSHKAMPNKKNSIETNTLYKSALHAWETLYLDFNNMWFSSPASINQEDAAKISLIIKKHIHWLTRKSSIEPTTLLD